MAKIEREDIQIISRHSNWSKESIDRRLQKEVYNDSESWHRFLKLFFVSLGVGFTTAGIIFFFAYNWADISKFIKIGLIESLIVITTAIVLFSKINLDIKNIILTGASMLVGVLFAVFGQIYQTGANAYDFFLGWTLCITLWVAVSNFAPLWFIFITLINTTVILYAEQVAHNWSEVFVFTLLFVINASFLLIVLLGEKTKKIKPPIWFSNIIALAAVFFSTIGICYGIFEKREPMLGLIIIASILYSIGIMFGLREKRSFYLAIIPFSIIIIISSLITKLSFEIDTFFLIGFFVVISVTIVIRNLINLQKKWTK